MIGILIRTVSRETTIVKIGSVGGGARVHKESSALQSHCEAPAFIFDDAVVHVTCNGEWNGRVWISY